MEKFNFTALPKCMVVNRPTKSNLTAAKNKGQMLFVIVPIQADKNVDKYIDGYLAGCGVERSENMVIFFNDTDLAQSVAQKRFTEEYNALKFPKSISGYTTIATGKKPNRLSDFLTEYQKIDDIA